MVSLISEKNIQNLPGVEVRPISELLDEYPGLDLSAVNHSSIPFVGWSELTMTLVGGGVLEVPFIVTKIELEQPIVGYNVVEEIIKEFPDENIICNLFPNMVKKENASQLINAIQTRPSEIALVSTPNKEITLAAGETLNIKCRANAGVFEKAVPMIFEPDEQQLWPNGISINEVLVTVSAGVTSRVRIPIQNETEHTIILPKKMLIGRLTSIISVIPVPVNIVKTQVKSNKESEEDETQEPSTEATEEEKEQIKTILSKIKLDHLTLEQKEKVEKLIEEE